MNYCGSYRKLLANAKAAMVAAIEIYNKPSFRYRDECVVILLLNAWELVLKATLSKNRQSIFRKKQRGRPYRTLSWQDALRKAEAFFPPDPSFQAVKKNLELLGTYRNNTVHFYNDEGFSTIVYALSQTAIVNFRDYVNETFGQRLEDEINWQLLPIGIKPPIDVLTYLSSRPKRPRSAAVEQFLANLDKAAKELQDAGEDTGRLLTVFKVRLESVKKIGDADVVIGVNGTGAGDGPLAIKKVDPNVTHPLRQSDIVGSKDSPGKIRELHGRRFTSHVFQAILWKYDLKTETQYCWRAKEGVLTRYSNDIITFIKRLTSKDVERAVEDYNRHQRELREAKKTKERGDK